jgi:2-desacetyl-2-hydroxyethyl bacteriochlorophyllide A dehydrogenase
MRYIVCEKPNEFQLKQKPMPVRSEGESILRIRRIGIFGTDIHAFGGNQPYFEYPRILGHELAAEYVEGTAEGFTTGDKLTFIPYFNCGKCIACRNGLTNCCVNMRVFGVHIDGGMSEYISVPDRYLIRSEGLGFEELALVEPLAVAAHGVRRAGVTANDTVLVMGAGPIGLGLVQFAQIAGAKVIVADVNPHRLAFCREVLHVEHLINPAVQDTAVELAKITSGDMPTVVIDATGNQKAMLAAFNYIAHGGRLVLVGLQKGELTFSHPDFHKRESTLMSSRNATREDFDFVIKCIKEGKVDPHKYITHKAPFDGMIGVFESWLKPESNVIKALVEID